MLGFGSVWSHNLRRPSAPQEANTFSEVGCHWTWLQFLTWAGMVNINFPFSVDPTCRCPLMRPATNNGFLYAHSTDTTSEFPGITQLFPFPMFQNEISPLPQPIRRNWSLSSNHDTSKMASLIADMLLFIQMLLLFSEILLQWPWSESLLFQPLQS